MPLGAMLGCPVTAGLVDKLGRKNMMMMLTLPTIVGWGMIIWAESVSIKYICKSRTHTHTYIHDFLMIFFFLRYFREGCVDLCRPNFNRICVWFLFRNRTPIYF